MKEMYKFIIITFFLLNFSLLSYGQGDVIWTVETVAGTGTAGWGGENVQASTNMVGAGFSLYYDSIENDIYYSSGTPFDLGVNTNRITLIDLDNDLMRTWAGTGGFLDPHVDSALVGTDNPTQFPGGIHKTPGGDIFFTEFSGNYVRHYRASDNIIYDVCGTGSYEYTGDGLLAYEEAELMGVWNPLAITISPKDGNLYWIEYKTIRRLNFSTGRVEIVYGRTDLSCTPLSSPDIIDDGEIMGPGVCFYPAGGMDIDEDGNIYFSTVTHAIQRIDAETNELTTIAGIQDTSSSSGGYNGDGPATSTLLDTPYGVHIGPDGNIWFCEKENGVVRKITDDGMVETVLGKDAPIVDGDEDFNGEYINADTVRMKAYDFAFGNEGEIYVVDNANAMVRKFYRCEPIEFEGFNDYFQDPCPMEEVEVSADITTNPSFGEVYWRLGSCNGEIIDTGATTTITYEANSTYYLTSESSEGCPQFNDFCEEISFSGECGISVSAFSPNGDNVNDFFYIGPASLHTQNHVTIFNRYGDEVYFVDNYDNEENVWGGESRVGGAVAPGTYYYVFQTDEGVEPYRSLRGWIQVVK